MVVTAVIWGASLCGCGDDVVVADGGPDASADAGRDGGVLVAPPNIPWLSEGTPPIMLAPCPEGWREAAGGVVTECAPYPEGGPAACAAGEAHFPGEAGCRPIGDACPIGDYATSLPTAGPVIYVKDGAAAGGDGTLATPFAALSEVPWVSLASSVTVALGKGTYAGTLPLKAAVTVIGACVGETIITGVAAPVPAVVTVSSAGEAAVVENLTLRGAPQGGVQVRGGRSLRLRGVLLDGVSATGVLARDPGSELNLTDVVVRDTEAVGSFNLGYAIGIHVANGARLTGARVLVLGNRGIGVYAADEGSRVTLTDAVIRDTRPRPTDGKDGRGIRAELGASVDAARVLVVGNRSAGVVSWGLGTRVALTDAVVRDTQPQVSDGESGRGISVLGEAEFSATRLLVARNSDNGILVDDPNTRVALTDVVIRDTRVSRSGPLGGRGLRVQRGARVEATRLLVVGNVGGGVVAGGEGTILSVTDGAVRDTASTVEAGVYSRSLWIQLAAHFEATRLLIADNPEQALGASDEGTTVNLVDVVIRDTRPRDTDQRFGGGIQAQYGAHIIGERVEVIRSMEMGVAAVGGASVVLEDATIRQVEVSGCVSTTCPVDHFGYAVGAFSGSVSLTRFQVSDAAICGVMVAPAVGLASPASLDLSAGIVSNSPIGACVQVAGYDINRLSADVRYQDNTTNLDSTMLPVPEPLLSLAP